MIKSIKLKYNTKGLKHMSLTTTKHNDKEQENKNAIPAKITTDCDKNCKNCPMFDMTGIDENDSLTGDCLLECL